MVTPMDPANEPKDGEDMKKIPTTTSVADVTADTVLNPSQRASAERALVWKLDLRLMPMIVLIYVMNFIGSSALSYSSTESPLIAWIDRTAVTAARLKGMEADLGLSGESVVVMCTF